MNLSRWRNLTPTRQLTYGCLGVTLIGAAVLYCLGAFSMLVRPILFERELPSDAREFILPATPTARPIPTFIQLPTGALVATPTQAPIPTREPPTQTPTLDPFATPSPTNGATTHASSTSTPRVSATPTRRVTASPTPR
ncbi:MAG: hypothetical protein HY070_07340 [Chloroflexi bacterium]|nr:hypothetical protein [Chloroflexota bacterium]